MFKQSKPEKKRMLQKQKAADGVLAMCEHHEITSEHVNTTAA